MTRSVKPAQGQSNYGTRKIAGRIPQTCGWFSPIAAELQRIFLNKGVTKEVAFRSGRSIKVVEKWFAGKVSPDGEALARLLCSDIGDRVHDAMIAGVKAPWAQSVRNVREIARLRAQQADTARRLAALERGIEP
ncbi:hypothetical protein [Bradyrhizobium sp. NAS96.2]|uniref:hypothetical protein n=1 Tax=Bradyrhizobium sp. NAS96.2 TaxID=1680160 RepID=UPI00093E5AC9|nr:hypothetical protein [Bradyrhizobium sp. NAS96.2]OKO73609.1 hypothetical protein AC628_23920 [Bradyrhizobium sp. NAS96.2]